MSTIKDGGPAFPVLPPLDEAGHSPAGYPYPDSGMSLRQYFAAHADIPWEVAAEIVYRQSGNRNGTPEQIIGVRTELRYAQADSMLRARDQEPS